MPFLLGYSGRYGVLPGYGITMQDGFEDVFTANAMAALEIGAMPYARGLITNQYDNYVRYDGLINYRSEEVAQQARMLTILSLYYWYSDVDETEFMLARFSKARAIADWLIARRTDTLKYGRDDPRYGILYGLDEGDNFVRRYFHSANVSHFYSHTAEAYRAFAELGEVWTILGKASGRTDVADHGMQLTSLAPLIYRDLHRSMNLTANVTASPGTTCYSDVADGYGTFGGCNFRAVPEMFYSGALFVSALCPAGPMLFPL